MSNHERMMRARDFCAVCHGKILKGRLRTGQMVDLEPHYEVYEPVAERQPEAIESVVPLDVASNNYGYARHICLPVLPRHVALLTENERLKGEIRRMTERKKTAESEEQPMPPEQPQTSRSRRRAQSITTNNQEHHR